MSIDDGSEQRGAREPSLPGVPLASIQVSSLTSLSFRRLPSIPHPSNVDPLKSSVGGMTKSLGYGLASMGAAIGAGPGLR
jgi:hypothetical protein